MVLESPLCLPVFCEVRIFNLCACAIGKRCNNSTALYLEFKYVSKFCGLRVVYARSSARTALVRRMDYAYGQQVLEEDYDENYEPTEEGTY